MSEQEKAMRRAVFGVLRRDRHEVVQALGSALTMAILEAHTQGRIAPHKEGLPPGVLQSVLDASVWAFTQELRRVAQGQGT